MSEHNNEGWEKRAKPLPVLEPKVEVTQVEIVGARIPFGQMVALIFKGFFAFLLAMILLVLVGGLITISLGGIGAFL